MKLQFLKLKYDQLLAILCSSDLYMKKILTKLPKIDKSIILVDF